MRVLKAAGIFPGIDTYYVPYDWIDVKAVYVVPVGEVTGAMRMRAERKLLKYKVDFQLLPPDPKNKLNPVQRRIVLRVVPRETAAIISAVILLDKP